jgi:hypothetical protein
MNRPDEAAEFERWLDRELPRAVATELDQPAPPPLAIPSRSPGRRRIAGFGLRGAAALVAVALAVVGGAALTTGSANPVSWGHQVVHAVTVGSLILQRTPAPTPDPAPPARSVTRAAGAEAQSQQSGGDTGGGTSADRGNQGGAKPGHGDASPPPGQDRSKDNGNQQGQNKP